MALSARTLNCAGPGTASNSVPGAADGVCSAPCYALSPMATTRSAACNRTAPNTNLSDPNSGIN
eukprot:12597762-Alexandrium_andersonii.AAC.1